MSDQTRRQRQHARQTARMKRARERINEALDGFEFEPAYLLSDSEYLHAHVECSRCHAVVRAVGMTPFDHWATHHRAKAALLRWWRRKTVMDTAAHQPMTARFTLSEGSAEVPDHLRDVIGDKGVERLNQTGRPLHD